jgi:hypothetical protein
MPMISQADLFTGVLNDWTPFIARVFDAAIGGLKPVELRNRRKTGSGAAAVKEQALDSERACCERDLARSLHLVSAEPITLSSIRRTWK